MWKLVSDTLAVFMLIVIALSGGSFIKGFMDTFKK